MKKPLRYIIATLIVSLYLFGCGNNKAKPNEDTPRVEQLSVENDAGQETEASSTLSANRGEEESLEMAPRSASAGEQAASPELSMPGKYLDDPLDFIPLEAPESANSGKYAVVASDRARLYQAIDDTKMPIAGLQSLVDLMPIPMGAILPIEARIAAEDSEYRDLFAFEDHLNYFYRTSYDGNPGMVFGADLVAIDCDADTVARVAWYYNKSAASPVFRPLDGMTDLDQALQDELKEHYIAFAPPPVYHLSAEQPDDLIEVYRLAFKDRSRTVFLTTDLYSHCLHLLFDRMLSETEQERFTPLLKELVAKFLDEIDTMIAADDKSVIAWTEALERARDYFAIAQVLVGMAEPLPTDKWGRVEDEAGTPEVDYRPLAAQLSPRAQLELKLIMDAKGYENSPCFDYKEDYSQFIPRGHYTKNRILKAYFRSMIFLGRIHFYLDTSTPAAAKASETLGPVALIANQIYFAKPAIASNWQSLFDPITWLIGESDDISFHDMDAVLGESRKADLQAWMRDGRMMEEIGRIGKALRAPRIQGNTAWKNPSAAATEGSGDLFGEAPKGWRLFGQRFAPDSSWTDRLTGGDIVSSDGQSARTMAAGLDVAAALGSKAAWDYLEDTRKTFPFYEKELRAIIEEQAARTRFDPEQSKSTTFYEGYLDLSGRMAALERGAGLYYMQGDRWNRRILQSSLGAWAELRHDTILYLKQSGAESAGGALYKPTFRTRPFARPIHLVEPNIPYFNQLEELLALGTPLLEEHGIMSESWKYKLEQFTDIVARSAAIARQQAADKTISPKENEWLTTIPGMLARIIVPTVGGGYGPADQYRMALIADVHTDTDNLAVLEVGIGKPLSLYLAANDGFGGKRIAKGYTLSYYEFPHPMNDRLTNEKWRAFIYGKPSQEELEAYRPVWLRGVIQQ